MYRYDQDEIQDVILSVWLRLGFGRGGFAKRLDFLLEHLRSVVGDVSASRIDGVLLL